MSEREPIGGEFRDQPAIAAFVTPHGFGHAARVSAVLEALHGLRPEVHPHLFTTTPEWFFTDSLSGEFTLHPLASDVGLVQKSSLEEDPDATADVLDGFLPFADGLVSDLAGQLARHRCRLVLADIAPLGIAAANAAGVPSVLVENFTWDWIYAAYFDATPRLRRHAALIAETNEACDLRIQAEPACVEFAGARSVPPVSRSPKSDPRAIRDRLDVGEGRPLVLLTMGGVEWSYGDLSPLRATADVVFVIPGAAEEPRAEANLRLLPHRSTFHHADLVATADALVGKLGYSTVAEAYRAGAPFLFLQRQRFPESPHLARFVLSRLPSREISARDFRTCAWLDQLPELLAAPRPEPGRSNGADTIARHLADLLDRS